MTDLTRINPAAYGIDALRRVALQGAGLSGGVVDRLAMTLLGSTIPIGAEVAVLACFDLAALGQRSGERQSRSFGTPGRSRRRPLHAGSWPA